MWPVKGFYWEKRFFCVSFHPWIFIFILQVNKKEKGRQSTEKNYYKFCFVKPLLLFNWSLLIFMTTKIFWVGKFILECIIFEWGFSWAVWVMKSSLDTPNYISLGKSKDLITRTPKIAQIPNRHFLNPFKLNFMWLTSWLNPTQKRSIPQTITKFYNLYPIFFLFLR